MRKLSTVAAGIAFVFLGTITNASAASAAIFSVDDSGSWITGSNELSRLNFNMILVPDSSVAEGTSVGQVSSPLGILTFSPQVQKDYIGKQHLWATWSNGYTGEVYDNLGAVSTTITLPPDSSAFDLYVEPNFYGQDYDIAVTAKDGTVATLMQPVNASGGAKYFGFYATDEDAISSITVIDKSGIADNGFAVGQLRLATELRKTAPEPTSILGLLAIGVGTGCLRRKQND